MFLIIWDKLFGTFQPGLTVEKYKPLKYGLSKSIEKETPVTIVFHEWSNIRKDVSQTDINWKEKLFYIFGPPGWSHNGSRKTSKELRQIENGEPPKIINELSE